MSLTSSLIDEPSMSLLDLTPDLPTAPEIVRYAVEQGVRFLVRDFRAHAQQTEVTDASDVAMGFIMVNQENVLRVITGRYYAGDFGGEQ